MEFMFFTKQAQGMDMRIKYFLYEKKDSFKKQERIMYDKRQFCIN